MSLLNFGCVKRDIDKISEGQDCLDNSTSLTALNCLSKVEGVESAGANLIRCSAYFIDQGFADTTRLANVAQQISNASGSSQDNTFAALSVMGFTAQKYSKSVNSSLSTTAGAVCEKSKSPGLIYLSSLSRIATTLLDLVGSFDPTSGIAPTAAEIETALCTAPTDATKMAIGAAAIAAYQNDCVLHQGQGNQDSVCQQYAAALAVSSDPLVVGGLLATNLCTP